MTNCNHKMNQKRPTIYAIDFDGTIVENKWPDIGEANQPVVDFIKAIQNRGDKWILWTMREGKYLQDAADWCLKHDLIPDTVNNNLPSLREAFGNNPRKVFANYYIDDHNAGGLVMPPLDDE